MATFSFLNGVCKINGVDMSAMTSKITLKTSAAELTNTAFGGTYESKLGGLKSGQLDVEFNQDFAAAQVDATLWTILGTVVTFDVRADAGARSVTNPSYTGNVLIKEYAPIDGKVGDLAVLGASWPTSGTITRATA